MIIVAPGSLSDGFTISVFPTGQLSLQERVDGECAPVTVAKAADHNTIIAGKLNGVIAAVTPKGNRRE